MIKEFLCDPKHMQGHVDMGMDKRYGQNLYRVRPFRSTM